MTVLTDRFARVIPRGLATLIPSALCLTLLVAVTACTGTSSTDAPKRPQQAGQPLDPAKLAVRIAEVRAAALVGDQAAVQRQMQGMQEDFRKSIKLPDPARRIDHEAARTAVAEVPGVRSVVWVDQENLLAMVNRNDLRSQQTIDAICLQLEPLGDTLGVVINLQSAVARTGDELEVLSRNCQLAPGDRAFMQRRRQLDVVAPEVREQQRRSKDETERKVLGRNHGPADAKALQAIPEM